MVETSNFTNFRKKSHSYNTTDSDLLPFFLYFCPSQILSKQHGVRPKIGKPVNLRPSLRSEKELYEFFA